MIYKKRLFSVFEQCGVAIIIALFQFLIFWTGFSTHGDFPVIQLYGITVVLAALYFGNPGVINTSLVATILIIIGIFLNKSTNAAIDMIGLGMFGFLVLFSNSLSKIKTNLDIKNKSLEVKSNVLNMHATQLRIINELGHKLVSSTAVEDVANLALKATRRLLKLKKASVIISNEEADNYIVHMGFDDIGNANDLLLNLWNDKLKAKLSKKDKLMTLKNTEPKLKVNFAVNIPIQAEDEIVGCISGYSKSSRRFNDNEIAFLSILAEEVGIAVRNSRLHQGLTRRALMLESLVNVSKTLSSPFRLDKIYRKLATLAASAVGAEGCAVLVAENGQKSVLIAASNLDPVLEGKKIEIAEGSPLFKAMNCKKTVNSAIGLYEKRDMCLIREDATSFIITPIIFEGNVIGALYFYSLTGLKFGAQDKILSRAIADQAALLINRAKVYEELKQTAQRSAILAQAGALLISNISLDSRLKVLLEKLKETLNVSKGMILLDDRDSPFGTLIVTEDKLPNLQVFGREDFEVLKNKTIKQGSCAFLNNSRGGEGKWLEALNTQGIFALSIMYQDTYQGIAVFFEPEREIVASQRQLSLARLIMDYSAVAIHTARLYSRIDKLRAESEDRASNLKTLLDVAQTISSSLNTRTVLRRTISLVKKMFNAEAAVLMLHDKFTGDLVTKINVGMAGAKIKDLRLKPPNEFIGSVFASRKASKLSIGNSVLHDSFIEYHQGKLKSAAAAPLLTRGREIGVISLYSKEENAFTVNDLELLSIFASQVALSIDTASIYEKEHQLVETLQRSLLPKIPSIEGLEIGVLYSPAHIQNEIGGDYYDFITFEPGVYGIVIGDVCGKGIDAATETAMARYYLQAFASKYKDPGTVLSYVNETIAKKDDCQLITMVYIVIDLNKMEIKYANAGHPPAFMLAGTKTKSLAATGPIIGAMPGADFTSKKYSIKAGDFIFLYTDGLIEVQNNGELFGEERLLDCIEKSPEKSMESLVHYSFMRSMEWGNNIINDDVACVGLKVQ